MRKAQKMDTPQWENFIFFVSCESKKFSFINFIIIPIPTYAA